MSGEGVWRGVRRADFLSEDGVLGMDGVWGFDVLGGYVGDGGFGYGRCFLGGAGLLTDSGSWRCGEGLFCRVARVSSLLCFDTVLWKKGHDGRDISTYVHFDRLCWVIHGR